MGAYEIDYCEPKANGLIAWLPDHHLIS